MPFGKSGDRGYDPVSLNLKACKKNREFEIVKLDREEFLGNERIRIVAILAPSFETLAMQTIESARALSSS